MATKKTPEELVAARAKRELKKQVIRQQQLDLQQKEEAEFNQKLPLMALDLLQCAKELRLLADTAGIPDEDDIDWDEENNIAIRFLNIEYILWDEQTKISFDNLLKYTKRDYDRFKSDFMQLQESFKTKKEIKRAAELERERVLKIRVDALNKLTDEEKKVLGIK